MAPEPLQHTSVPVAGEPGCCLRLRPGSPVASFIVALLLCKSHLKIIVTQLVSN